MDDSVSPAFSSVDPTQPTDAVLQFLMAVNLADAETEFRGVIDSVAKDPLVPQLRDLTIAMVAVLMTMGGVHWPVVMRVVNHLAKLPDAQLKEAAVAVINGAHLLLPKGEDDVLMLDIMTLRESPDIGPAFVSTVYSCTAVWERATQIFAGR